MIKKFSIKDTNVDQAYPFDFKFYKPKIEGMIILFSLVILPLVTVIFLNVFKKELNITDSRIGLIFQLSSIVFTIIGGLIFWSRNPVSFWKSGVGILFGFPIFLQLFAIFFSLLANVFNVLKNGGVWTQIYNLLIQTVAEILIIIFAFNKISNLKNKVKQTLKENKKLLIPISIGFAVVAFIVGNTLYSLIISQLNLNLGESENQKSLVSPFQNDGIGKYIYMIIFIILTIFIAPLCEEIIARQALFTGVSNKVLSIITSSLYFGVLHISSGDVYNIFPYVIGGFFFSLAFSLSKGNLTYSWFSHSIYNTISVVLIIASLYIK
ncbi:CPBP family intramembrane glutamic endopeptidase [Mycoplasma mycoides]|uniref:CPBP family intramembrane glutamic endopeptidase n=1 Tax=Mycoplasma mycoides TaxID=2102 RepID=UPI00273353AB|nr:CPBP family glutamic-type intramembrane protease [Mycoplasma mycoides]MDP4040343.1 CPBP family glutamic-type intramembrane protease [Mycoplasma mycoides]MDP4041209.1 CPBP family glutamic-type intramembrane protease [Mycoplasma mycoides]MDP4042116.1 CPBP family glutamic-type intramembrane protease [Mycoplasma mycoides]MDP4043518.1 CPBP family glutamic-type intramembrane protease [Mycoplasma mycoides]MDP4044386.1 CPBP family glutamic-type intramembrane protease [Mycoplasma mycoides]